jgi:hypothetical protein
MVDDAFDAAKKAMNSEALRPHLSVDASLEPRVERGASPGPDFPPNKISGGVLHSSRWPQLVSTR